MVDSELFSQWRENLQGTNMVVVLNTMEEIVRDGDWSALGLLTVAGDGVVSIARQLPVTLPSGKVGFEEFREDCIRRLQQRLGAKEPDGAEAVQDRSRVFISYNHQDRESANALALELARSEVDVFLDHWEMAPNEEILPRIERELRASDVVIALLSPRSATSSWVQRELEIVIARQEAEGTVLLLPVLLENCAIPEAVAARPYHDLRDARNLPAVAQAIINQIGGNLPFSQRVLGFLADPPPGSPYTPQAQQNGHRLLQELAKHQEMEVARNQRWLLWELFHKLVDSYQCTLKIGRRSSHDDATEHYEFVIVDRWNETASTIILTPEEFERGLWEGEVDLLDRHTARSDTLQHLGSLGRLSSKSAYNPNVGTNTAEPTSRKTMRRLLRSFAQTCDSLDDGSKQSFLFDLQRLIVPGDWHRLKIVVGSAIGGDTLAHSPMIAASEDDEVSGVFELYDPFFASLKFTQANRNQLHHHWEGDVNLMSSSTETLLGLS